MNSIFPLNPWNWTLACIIVFITCSTSLAQESDKVRRPNIVVVLVDDMRWDEFGAAGHNYLKTPNIDRIAKEGANFINAFATTPLCSPSRASFLPVNILIPTASSTTQHAMSRVTNLTHFQNNFMIMAMPLHS